MENCSTSKRLEFIGTTFTTPKNGKISVVALGDGVNSKGYWDNKYICTCTLCSKDEKLWPYGSLRASKYTLLGGSFPCGCVKQVKWSSSQICLLIDRLLENTTFTRTSTPVYAKSNFTLRCEVCSEDKELWPDGSIQSQYNVLNRWTKPCGCSLSPKWTEAQNLIRCKRYVKSKPLRVLGYAEEYRANRTRLVLQCTEESCGAISRSVAVEKLLTGRGCPSCGDKRAADSFRKKWEGQEMRSPLGGLLSVVEDLKNKDLLIHCTKCAEDSELYGKGLFTIKKDVWVRGSTSCGCSNNYNYSKDQALVKLNRRGSVLSDKISVVGFKGEWKGMKTYVVQKCLVKGYHEDWDTTTIGGALSSGGTSGCPACGRGLYGYYFTRKDDLDNLYLLLFENLKTDEVFVKIGRSFNLKDRIKCFPDTYKVSVVDTFSERHKNILPFERYLHAEFKPYHYTPSIPFGGSVKECFKVAVLDDSLLQKIFQYKRL